MRQLSTHSQLIECENKQVRTYSSKFDRPTLCKKSIEFHFSVFWNRFHMSSNWDEANLVHLTGKRAKKKRNQQNANQPKQKKNLVFNPFAYISYRTPTPENADDMYSGSQLFPPMHQKRSQQHPITETIDLSADMECDNDRVVPPTHGKTNILS